MGKYKKTCLLCKNGYEYCSGCSKFKHLPIYMTIFCSENCKTTYEVMNNYESGIIDVDTAKKQLDELDTSRHMYYTKSFANTYNRIYGIMNETDEDIEKEVDSKTDDLSSVTIDNVVVDETASKTISDVIENNTISTDEISDNIDKISQASTFKKKYKKNK